MTRLLVVGTGAVGRAVAALHARRGAPVGLVSRDAARAATAAADVGGDVVALPMDAVTRWNADAAVVAVPDRAVADTGAALRAAGFTRLVVHTSGALPGATLGGGRPAGSLHPLQSFPSGASVGELAARAAGAHWFHEGDGRAESEALVAGWGGLFHALAPGSKALYHAGAAVLSNHTVALFADAVRLFAAAGIPRDAASSALAGLLAGTCANIAALGVPAALTGPVARGDAATVRAHVAALRTTAPELLAAYAAMARRAAVVAREKGSLDAAGVAEIEAALGG